MAFPASKGRAPWILHQHTGRYSHDSIGKNALQSCPIEGNCGFAVEYNQRNPWKIGPDVGTGSGEMAEAIALDGHEVVGIDKSSKAIAIARARVQLPNAKFIQADATNLPFEECSFAAAVCYLSLHHFRDPFPVLDEVLRVLRAGGTFIIVEYQDLLRRLLYAIDACSTRFQAHPMGGFSISSLLVEIYRRFDVLKVVHYPMLVMLVSKKPACCL